MRIALFTTLLACTATAQDTLHFVDPAIAPLPCEALHYSATELRVRIQDSDGDGSHEKVFPLTEVKEVIFGLNENETRWGKNIDPSKDGEAIRDNWRQRATMIGRPKSEIGALGISYIKAILQFPTADAADREIALEFCQTIETEDWSEVRRNEARGLRLRILIADGRVEEALKEAEKLHADTDDPRILLEFLHMKTLTKIAKLHQLEADHPRWEIDDKIRPEREALYHEIHDELLEPMLLHGSAQSAAESLNAAMDEYMRAGQPLDAAPLARDLIHLYPSQPQSERAKKFLAELKLPVEPPIPQEDLTSPTP